MSSFTASTRKSLTYTLKDVETYRRYVVASCIADGCPFDKVTPRPSGTLVERFKYHSERFDAVMKEKPSPERDQALRIIRFRLWHLVGDIEYAG